MALAKWELLIRNQVVHELNTKPVISLRFESDYRPIRA
jgi:hypothetical protein